MRVLLDSNIYDEAAKDAEFRQLLKSRQESGHIRLLSTTVETNELAAIPPSREMGQVAALQTERVGTAVFLLGVSVLGIDTLGSDEANETFERLLTSARTNLNDSLLGSTAIWYADILVTEDGRFARRLKRLNTRCRVLSVDEFRAYLAGLG